MPCHERCALRRSLLLAGPLLLALLFASAAGAAALPPHGPLRILIVSDEVNPHGLSDAQLTQPGDLAAALAAFDSGLSIDPGAGGLLEVPTDQLGTVTPLISVAQSDPAAYDVLIYFAHRAPNTPDGATLQTEFTQALEQYLIGGGTVIAFHHGLYEGTGKSGIMPLIGMSATGSVLWDTTNGQRIIDVAPSHFITTWNMVWPGGVSYSDPAHGIPASVYPTFQNIPDERYPNTTTLAPLADLEIILASDDPGGAGTGVLVYVHQRPEWQGLLIGFQPGEYQPSALDDRSGPMFQMFANAIVWGAQQSAAQQAPVIGPLGSALLGGMLAAAGLCAAGLRSARRPRSSRAP